jgi:hypothetical protein
MSRLESCRELSGDFTQVGDTLGIVRRNIWSDTQGLLYWRNCAGRCYAKEKAILIEPQNFPAALCQFSRIYEFGR